MILPDRGSTFNNLYSASSLSFLGLSFDQVEDVSVYTMIFSMIFSHYKGFRRKRASVGGMVLGRWRRARANENNTTNSIR